MGGGGLLGRAGVVNGLPARLEQELLLRWREGHRRYHGESHLRHGLAALDLLGAGPLEVVAFWFHDAIHTSTSPADELASAELARELLADLLPAGEIEEVARLVLVTADHDPAADDAAGQRISDADLCALASQWDGYQDSAAAVRAERPDVDDAAWRRRRLGFITTLQRRAEIFRTPLGLASWEADARRNLARERLLITTQPAAGRSDA